MIIFGIETSCDETACAVVEGPGNVLSSVVSSQIPIHRPFGGIVPEIASREHLTQISGIARDALQRAGVEWPEIDGIAVTQGPGLIGSLLVGISFAKGLALTMDKPLVPVDHIHAHIHGALLGLSGEEQRQAAFPLLALVVSGGHTNLYLMRDPLDFCLIGYSMDDACGECFDKVAKMLGLPYPGGPAIEKLALNGDPGRFQMPRVSVSGEGPFLFSYSGLKTFMVNLLRKEGAAGLDPQLVSDLCASFQKAAFEQVFRKLNGAIREFSPKAVIIAGGVSANGYFRKMMLEALSEPFNLPCLFPRLEFCGDNGAMIAALGCNALSAQARHWGRDRRFDWDAYSKYNFMVGS